MAGAGQALAVDAGLGTYIPPRYLVDAKTAPSKILLALLFLPPSLMTVAFFFGVQ